MNILITAGASALAQDLAETLSKEHSVRLTDVVDVQTQLPFVRCDLGHDAETDRLVAGVDVLIHLAASHSEYAESTTDNSEISANRLIDYQTRCTYNLLHAASEAGVSRCIYASSLCLFARCDDDWAVNEQWRPRPATEPPVLAQHLGEFVCREFARERRIAITCLRLGNLGQPDDNAEKAVRPNMAVATQTPCTLLNARWRLPHSPGPSIIYSRSFRERVSAAARRGCNRLCSASRQLGE